MMNQVHFASMEDEDDDMYGGFNDFSATDMTQVLLLMTMKLGFNWDYLIHWWHEEWHFFVWNLESMDQHYGTLYSYMYFIILYAELCDMPVDCL